MALRYGDRVKETTATTGTGTWTLAGAVSGFVAFSAIPNSADGDLVPYRAEQGTNWEVGIGTLGGSKTTLARTVILASSNSGSAVNFASGPTIVCDLPAEKAMHPTLTEFTASGTFTPKPTSKFFFVVTVGGGGGGGSGGRHDSNNNRSGGNGGTPGMFNFAWFTKGDIGSSVTVTIGAGGAGAAGKTSDGFGTQGSAGGNTTFGSLLVSKGGNGGGGGYTSTADITQTSTAGLAYIANPFGYLGGYASGTAFVWSAVQSTSPPQNAWIMPGGGGTGGGMNKAGSYAQPSSGGTGKAINDSGTTGGGGGSAGVSQATPTAGGAGAAAPSGSFIIFGQGGGGGGASLSANGAAGGAGGSPGGGGGGGGAAATGQTSGAGGNGADGCVRVLEW